MRISDWSSDVCSSDLAFVIVVVGGMGSIGGAFLAALVIAEIKAFCIGIGDVSVLGFDLSFSKLTLVVEFLVMAGVLVARPWRLLGTPQAAQRGAGTLDPRMHPITGKSCLAAQDSVSVCAAASTPGDTPLPDN